MLVSSDGGRTDLQALVGFIFCFAIGPPVVEAALLEIKYNICINYKTMLVRISYSIMTVINITMTMLQ